MSQNLPLTAELNYRNDLPEVPSVPALLKYPFNIDALVKERPPDIQEASSFSLTLQPADGILIPASQFLLMNTLRTPSEPIQRTAADDTLLDPSSDAFAPQTKQSSQNPVYKGYLRRMDFTRTSRSEANRRIKREPATTSRAPETVAEQFEAAASFRSVPLSQLRHPKSADVKAVASSELLPASAISDADVLSNLTHVLSEESFTSSGAVLRQLNSETQSNGETKKRKVMGVFQPVEEGRTPEFKCSHTLGYSTMAKDELLLVSLPTNQHIIAPLDGRQIQLMKKSRLPDPNSISNLKIEYKDS
ncbi:hypothetical protein GEMRC1_006669 [Eukaryota sp. GEM-RC1]